MKISIVLSISVIIVLAGCEAQTDHPPGLADTDNSQGAALAPQACHQDQPFTPCLISTTPPSPPHNPMQIYQWEPAGQYIGGDGVANDYCILLGKAGIQDGTGSGVSLRGYLPGDAVKGSALDGQWVLSVSNQAAGDNMQAHVGCFPWVPGTTVSNPNPPPRSHTLHEIQGVSATALNPVSDLVKAGPTTDYCPFSAFVGRQDSIDSSAGIIFGGTQGGWFFDVAEETGNLASFYAQCVTFSGPTTLLPAVNPHLSTFIPGGQGQTQTVSGNLTTTIAPTNQQVLFGYCALAYESGDWTQSCSADIEDLGNNINTDTWSLVVNCYGPPGTVVGAQALCANY